MFVYLAKLISLHYFLLTFYNKDNSRKNILIWVFITILILQVIKIKILFLFADFSI